MFFVEQHEDEKRMALKPMNCPGHMLLFGSELRSYRELPMRFAESSTLHRDERGGTLRSEEHTSELQSRPHLVCRLLLEKKKRIVDYKDSDQICIRRNILYGFSACMLCDAC